MWQTAMRRFFERRGQRGFHPLPSVTPATVPHVSFFFFFPHKEYVFCHHEIMDWPIDRLIDWLIDCAMIAMSSLIAAWPMSMTNNNTRHDNDGRCLNHDGSHRVSSCAAMAAKNWLGRYGHAVINSAIMSMRPWSRWLGLEPRCQQSWHRLKPF